MKYDPILCMLVNDADPGFVKRSGYGIDLYYTGSDYEVVDNRRQPPMILRKGSKAVMESEYNYIVSKVKEGKPF